MTHILRGGKFFLSSRVEGLPTAPATLRQLWDLAQTNTPADRVAHYTQAIMDLGATVCVRARPLCSGCPLAENCVARAAGKQAVLPTPRPKKARPQRTAYVVMEVRADGAALLERRPPAGIWGGLWTFPQFEDRTAAQRWVEQRVAPADSAQGQIVRELLPYAHSFTHFDLTLHPILVRSARDSGVADAERYCWYDPSRPARIGLAKPAVDLIRSQSTGASEPTQPQGRLP